MNVNARDWARIFNFVTMDPRGRFLLPYFVVSVFGAVTPVGIGIFRMNKVLSINKSPNT